MAQANTGAVANKRAERVVHPRSIQTARITRIMLAAAIR
jgi:hypothetical protein